MICKVWNLSKKENENYVNLRSHIACEYSRLSFVQLILWIRWNLIREWSFSAVMFGLSHAKRLKTFIKETKTMRLVIWLFISINKRHWDVSFDNWRNKASHSLCRRITTFSPWPSDGWYTFSRLFFVAIVVNFNAFWYSCRRYSTNFYSNLKLA